MVSLYKIGSQITLSISSYTLVLTQANGAFNGLGYTRSLVDELTNRIAGYTAKKSAFIEGSDGGVHQFLFDLNLRRTEFRTLWRMYTTQQTSKEGILLVDERIPFEGLGSPVYQSFLIWIDQPPIEIAGSVYNTNAGSTTAGDCRREVLQRVAFSATQIP
jgi:hypothetical protein